MIFGSVILATALLLSTVAAYYSIMGLTAIFAAAVLPVMIMGAILELGKVVTTVWLHNNWSRASWVFKTYMIPAVFFLMLLTSMGIFGLLSKAHSDQSLVSGDVAAKIAIYDEKIQTEKDNIDADRKALKQMDEAVDQVMARSTSEEGASRSGAIRRGQQKERARLAQDITASQQRIASLNEERAPIAAEVRKVEAEVGPIKYIAALLYGDNPDSNVLERAVRWVIILIVLVFDPLALCLILAANKQFEWARQGTGGFVHDTSAYPPNDGPLTDKQIEQLRQHSKQQQPTGPVRAKQTLFQDFEAVREPNSDWIQTGPVFEYHDDHPEYEWDDTLDTDVGEKPTEEEKAAYEQFVETRNAGKYPESDLPEPVQAEVASAGGEYVEVNGKRMHHKAFDPASIDAGHAVERQRAARLQADNEPVTQATQAGFGTDFPSDPSKGDTFVRVDRLPSTLYKYNGREWINVDKETSNSYLYQDNYLDYLIARIDSGEYDPELLSDTEREAIARRLDI